MKLQRQLLLEIGSITLLAVIVGLTINHRLLRNAWYGSSSAAAAPAAMTTTEQLPLPAGLLQVKELHAQQQAIFIDARDPYTFAEGHISGALSLPLGDADTGIVGFMAKTPFTTTIVVYCNGYGCHDSMDLADKLLRAGYQQVFVFEGGFPEWRDAGLPVSGGKP
jgi:rhodanese-related sulfurtransferase